MKMIRFNNQYLIILLLCLATQSGNLFGAWKNLCPDNLRCAAMAPIYYTEPGEIIGNSGGVTLSYKSIFDRALGEDESNVTTRLVVYPDRVEVPEWDAQLQPGGTFLQHSNGNWITMLGSDQTFVLDPSGNQLHYQDHRVLAADVSIGGPVLEDNDTVFYLKHGFLYSSADAGLTWTETRNWNGLKIGAIYNNPFGSGLYAVGVLQLTIASQPKYGLFNIFSDGTWNQVDDLRPMSSFDTIIRSIAFDHHPENQTDPIIYAATNNGILISGDKGRSWSQLGALDSIVHSLAVVDEHSPKRLIASTDNAGIIASKDQGKTWTPFAQGLLHGKRNFLDRPMPPHVYYLNGQLLARTQGGWYRCADFDCEGEIITPPAPRSKPEVLPVVEFYNSTLDHYFITSDTDEAAAIDAGQAGAGWSRTGHNFTAWHSLGLSMGKTVCRFYGSQSPGPNSHFFSASAGECDSLHQLQKSVPTEQPRWNFEGLPFMVAKGRVASAEECAEGHIPIYRAYNKGHARGVDSNHRFVADQAEIDKLVVKGWADEGIAFCALP